MAVTNLADRMHPGKVILGRKVQGNGVPTSDATTNGLANDTKYPVGSDYLDLDTGKEWSKRTIAGASRWVIADAVS